MSQIRFFQIPFSDISNPNFTFTVSSTGTGDAGAEIVNYMRNRNLTSAWLTTESLDSDIVTIVGDMIDPNEVTSVFLVDHNLKDFKLEWFDGATWTEFANVTGNTLETTEHKLVGVTTCRKVRLTIYATMVADDDKRITQFNIVQEIGQLNGYPEISGTKHTLGQKKSKMLSGKYSISESVGSFEFELSLDLENDQHDIDIYESIFFRYRTGVMVNLSGGDEDQFSIRTVGYRNKDFYVVKPDRDYSNDFYKAIYTTGIKLKVSFVEVV